MSPEAIDARDKIIASEARAQALEEAAALAERTASYDDDLRRSVGFNTIGKSIATAIRELKKGPANV